MPQTTKTRRRKSDAHTLGRKGFAKISTVEGIDMRSVEAEFEEFDRRGLSPEERRREIARKYGGKR
jgi:hypothetical protein